MARARAGAPVVIVNPTMPVGPGDRGVSPPTRLIRDFCDRKLPARMDCTLNLIDVRDVAEGLILAMECGLPGRRYLLGGENLTLVGLLGILSELTGVPVPQWSVPYPLGLAVAFVSELWADRVTGRPPKATVTGVRLTRRAMHFDSSRSLRGSASPLDPSGNRSPTRSSGSVKSGQSRTARGRPRGSLRSAGGSVPGASRRGKNMRDLA